ncbi:hypothetical protein V2G26_004039 [Clonostachys chloroleuca]
MGMLSLLIGALWASSVALCIEIPQTPTWPSGRCTDKSLTIPSWIITKYTVSGGTATFRVENRAADPTGLNADIECKGTGQCQGSSGSDEMRVSLSQEAGGTIITITELWVCGDAGDKVIFYASGSTAITQCQGSDCVSPIPYLVQGSTTLPVPLSPTQPVPPPGFDQPSCSNIGDDQWVVSEVSYKNYTKGQCKQWYSPDRICLDPVNFLSKGIYLHLKVTNNAIAHEVACDFTPSYGSSSPPSPLRCTGGEFNEIILDVTLTGTAPNFDLQIEQLWYCLENPSTNVSPTVITASGNTSLPLECASSAGITGSADDIITTCTDPSSSHSAQGTQDAKNSLPDFSLVTAYPAKGGCTFDSVVNPTWYMRGMFFETNDYPADNPKSATLSRFTCGLTGPGFADYFFYVYEALSGSGIETVYNCNSYNDGKPVDDHWNCTYSFNPFNKIISLNKVWKCSDKNKEAPLYFNGIGTFDWKVDPYYRCTTTDTSLSCSWYDSLATLQPGLPFDIPTVTVSLTKVAPARIESLRINGNWTLEGAGGMFGV